MDLLNAYTIANKTRDKLKDLDKDKQKKAIENLSEQEQEAFNELMRGQIRINYVFKDDDRADYTEDVDELKERCEAIKNAIDSYNTQDLWYTKESITNPYILQVLAHCIKDTDKDLDVERINELIGNYNRINDFIYDNYDNEAYSDIIQFYGTIVDKDNNGFYEVNDAIANRILTDNDFNVKDKDDLEDIKQAISLTWENKKEILDPSTINDISEKQNGINFKQFIFCEEYLKRGKIKPTCEHLGISRNTAYLWLKDDKVQEYLKKRQDEIKQETDDTFLQTYRASFNQLNKMINSYGIDTTDKIKAIDVFLKHYENIERLKQPSTMYED